MHKGRPFPFHPKYWATHFAFWPHYFSWKLRLGIDPTFGGEWYLRFPPLPGPISPAGAPDDPPRVIRYRWVAPLMTIDGVFDDYLVGGVLHGRLTLTATGIGGGVSVSVLDLGASPVNIYSITPTGTTSAGLPDFPLGGTLQIRLAPVTYAEGGSPW